MRRIRIGNQISLQWEIFNGDTAYDLLERTNKVFLVAAMIKQQVEFTLSGEHHNIINVVWAGADQKFCGEYHLLLVSNENAVNMFSLDSKPCLVLTPVTEHDAENRAVTVELTDNIYLPTSGESLYEMMVRTGRFEGTEEEFLQQYVDTLNNADAATYSLRRLYRDSCFAKSLNIPVDCSSRYLKLFCQFGSRCLFFLQ